MGLREAGKPRLTPCTVQGEADFLHPTARERCNKADSGRGFRARCVLKPHWRGQGVNLRKLKLKRPPVDIKARYRKRRLMRIGWVRAIFLRKCFEAWKTQGQHPNCPPAATRITRGYVHQAIRARALSTCREADSTNALPTEGTA